MSYVVGDRHAVPNCFRWMQLLNEHKTKKWGKVGAKMAGRRAARSHATARARVSLRKFSGAGEKNTPLSARADTSDCRSSTRTRRVRSCLSGSLHESSPPKNRGGIAESLTPLVSPTSPTGGASA